jgi:hypothetical protein
MRWMDDAYRVLMKCAEALGVAGMSACGGFALDPFVENCNLNIKILSAQLV